MIVSYADRAPAFNWHKDARELPMLGIDSSLICEFLLARSALVRADPEFRSEAILVRRTGVVLRLHSRLGFAKQVSRLRSE
jgi:hypothetical protein